MHAIFTAHTTSTTKYGLKCSDTTQVSLHIYGTWDSANVAVHVSDNGGVNYVAWAPDGTALAFTANKQVTFTAGPGQRFALVITSAGASTSLNAYGGGRYVELKTTATG